MKKKSKKKAIKSTGGKKKTSTSEGDKINPFDFGGLPQRDIKKNLGC